MWRRGSGFPDLTLATLSIETAGRMSIRRWPTSSWTHGIDMKIPARNKYRAVRTEFDGRTFDSKREAAEYAMLRLRERAGEVSDIECQPVFPLVVNGRRIGRCTADFRF